MRRLSLSARVCALASVFAGAVCAGKAAADTAADFFCRARIVKIAVFVCGFAGGFMFSVLRQRGFSAFLIMRLCVVFAMQIQAVVVAWEVYDITREPMALAYVGLAQFLPMLPVLPFAGDVADRFSRKAVLACGIGLMLLCSGALFFLSWGGAQRIWQYFLVLPVFGAARSLTNPALQSLLPQIVPRARLAQSMAANSTLMRIGVIGGPLLGGILYAAGGAASYAVCGIFLLAALFALAFVAVRFDHTGENVRDSGNSVRAVWRRFAEGGRFIWSHPIILGTISLDLFAVLLGGVIALLPIYAQEVLHVGAEGLGLLRSAMAVGEVLTGLYLSRFPVQRHVGKVMFAAVALFGAANLVFALSTAFWLSFAALAAAGVGDMLSVYIRSTLVQFSTPDYLRGRVSSVNMLFIGSSNELGEFRAGTSAAWFGPVQAAVIGSVCTLGIVFYMMRRFPVLRDVDKFEDAAHIAGG